ncbi:MAG: NAD(P)-dependent oxidoreductase [Brucellaceae bacterium]|nr:NAD(P)-dependent oxidoreductase [Brucellaceae bacterium]
MGARRAIVSGGTGFVGRFVVERFLEEGYSVTVTGRSAPPAGAFLHPVRFVADHLEPDEDHAQTFAGADYFVHCAFDHVPGKYRGGEGDDPIGFRRRNLEGTLARFRAAKAAGVKRVVFLSSRAVYGDQQPDAALDEATEPHPNSLYGEVKLACETGLAELAGDGFCGVSLRATGVYGPPPAGQAHKWAGLVADFCAGRPVASRLGTEVHGDDLAWAVVTALTARLEKPLKVFCVSDILVDNADIASICAEVTGIRHALPERCDAGSYNAMSSARLKALGWRPGGWPLFEASVRELAAEVTA